MNSNSSSLYVGALLLLLPVGNSWGQPRFRSDVGGKGPPRTELALHLQICQEAGLSSSCAKAAVLLEQRGQRNRAIPLYQKACQDTVRPLGMACFLWGRLLRDPKAALQAYQRACSLKDADGCTSAGDIYLMKKKNQAKAMPLYRKGCAMQDGRGCHRVGHLLMKQRRPAQALAMLLQSCRLRYPPGCGYAGWYLETKQRNFRRAEQFYLQGCRLRDPVTCGKLGLFYLNRKKPQQARPYLQKACRLGFQKSCNTLRKLSTKKGKPPKR